MFIVTYEVGQCTRGHRVAPMLVIIGKEFEGWTAPIGVTEEFERPHGTMA